MKPAKDREIRLAFVKENYGRIRNRRMAEELNVSAITITRLVRELGLTDTRKQNYKGPKEDNSGIFKVTARKNWLIGSFLLFCLAAGAQDRPWVKDRDSDTIYHTVVSVYPARPPDTAVVRYMEVDRRIKVSQAPRTTLQVDSLRPWMVDTTAALMTVSGSGLAWDASWVTAKAHKSHRKKHKKRYRWVKLVPGPRQRIYISWYTHTDEMTIIDEDFRPMTMKQWDSIGRVYILNKKYVK